LQRQSRDQVFEEISFSLAQSNLYLYNDGLYAGLARVRKQPDEMSNLQSLINKYFKTPRQ